jgi:hypothetical protein
VPRWLDDWPWKLADLVGFVLLLRIAAWVWSLVRRLVAFLLKWLWVAADKQRWDGASRLRSVSVVSPDIRLRRVKDRIEISGSFRIVNRGPYRLHLKFQSVSIAKQDGRGTFRLGLPQDRTLDSRMNVSAEDQDSGAQIEINGSADSTEFGGDGSVIVVDLSIRLGMDRVDASHSHSVKTYARQVS